MSAEQSFYLDPQWRVVLAGPVKICGAIWWIEPKDRMENLFGPRVATRFVRHALILAGPFVIRRYSQARATSHSRVTVAREMDKTNAISRSVSPAKYFNSTMWDWR